MLSIHKTYVFQKKKEKKYKLLTKTTAFNINTKTRIATLVIKFLKGHYRFFPKISHCYSKNCVKKKIEKCNIITSLKLVVRFIR